MCGIVLLATECNGGALYVKSGRIAVGAAHLRQKAKNYLKISLKVLKLLDKSASFH
jgi:hypothetical protein